MATSRAEIPQFDGSGDFTIWKKRMLANITVQGLKDLLAEKEVVTMTEQQILEETPAARKKCLDDEAELLERDDKALNLIIMYVGDRVLRKLDKCKTAAQAWETLDRLYMEKTLPNRVHAELQVYSYRMVESLSIDQNVDGFLKLIADLSNLSIDIPDEVQAILLLNALPARFDYLKETLKYGRNSIKSEEVISSAKSKEREYSDSAGHKTIGEGHYVRGRTEFRGTSNAGKFNKYRSRSKSKDGKRVCWICGKEGHFKKQCYKWLEKNKEKSHSQDNGESALARDDAKDLVGLVACEVNLMRGNNEKEEWILDTGCSFHMTPRRDMFIDFKEASSGKVKMANSTHSEVKGIGSVRFLNPDGTTFVLHDVRYMPEIGRNLISLGTLENKGCEFKGSQGVLKVVKGCIVIIKASRQDNDTLYVLQGSAKSSEANNAETSQKNNQEDDTQLWHSRLGHVRQKNLDVLVKKGCIEKGKVSELKFCEDCVIGKTHKASFGPAQHVTKEKLDYIHSDLWGSPNVPPSLGRCQYFISFTDDWSRKVWLYFLKTKDEAFDKFVEWKKMVETQSERKVKKLRTDNGLEFCNIKFDQFCKSEGVVRHKTCTYTPQQNGIAERLNRTLMNKIRSMLSESGLEQKFWAEAASTAVYLTNRTPSSAIEFDIPEERWTSAVPSLESLRRFGCIAYVHSSDGKLNPRTKKGIFTGYPEGVKGFRVWLLEESKVTISRNVVFREDVVYKDLKSETNSGNPLTEQVSTDTFVSVDIADYQLVRDRPKRQAKLPVKLEDYQLEEDFEDIAGYAYLIIEDGGKPEPGCYEEALSDPDSELWVDASDEEIASLMKNKTWILVDRRKDKKAIGCKWVFKRKAGIAGVEAPRFKARLVAKGYSQKEGNDYQEIFSPVVKHVFIRFLLSAVTHFDM
ncbi:unnamed protein product [Microthlaspi erraticum]|uniref:Integrase catalytic domain-containing protein n=1 Tax=Microthlaspi erraticum TaxID=1685480 RepID=A0A6D2K301_9BRAS|nr:unnamed protein product [Microthlaspi erraticum]